VRSLAKRNSSALKAFKGNYDKGMAAAKSRKSQDAVKYLTPALKKAEIIMSGGNLQAKIKKELSGVLYLKGRLAFNSEKYGEAHDSWSKALRIDPSQNYAKDGLKDLKNKAHQLYLEGYTQKVLNREVAIRKFKQVIAMTNNGDEDHEKAQRQLDGLTN